jgi:hypothetical protein
VTVRGRAARFIRYPALGIAAPWLKRTRPLVHLGLFVGGAYRTRSGGNVLVIVSLRGLVVGPLTVRTIPRWQVLSSRARCRDYLGKKSGQYPQVAAIWQAVAGVRVQKAGDLFEVSRACRAITRHAENDVWITVREMPRT